MFYQRIMMWFKRVFFYFFYLLLNNVPKTVWDILHVVTDIYMFWWRKFMDKVRPRSRTMYREAVAGLYGCDDYEEWYEKASLVDELTGVDLWRRNFFSKRFDFEAVLEQYAALMESLEEDDFETVKSRFTNTGPTMLRNFAGIVDKRLFTKSLVGTKLLIEQYLDKVVDTLYLLTAHPEVVQRTFFQRCKLSLGATALALQGGSLFGLFHLGVLKGLLDRNLLPNIINGTSMGACVASMACCLSDGELEDLLTGNRLVSTIKRDTALMKECGYGNIDEHFNIGTLVENVVHNGYSKDVYLFIKFIQKSVIGDLTFEEAFQRTGKVLNIVVHPTNKNICPNLLNYVTTPNVLISSAIDCSFGTNTISKNTWLLGKNIENKIVDYLDRKEPHYQELKFSAPQYVQDSSQLEAPYTRLTELFNVNNFIVSLARPYLAPLALNDLKHDIRTSEYYYYKRFPYIDPGSYSPMQLSKVTKLEPLAFKFKYHLERKMKHILTMELKHRVEIMDSLGLLSNWIKRIAIDEKTPRSATEVAIVPHMNSLSVSRIIEGRLDNINYWMKCGQESTWPVISLVKTRCAVEFTLDDIIKGFKKSI
ncbi:bifunctional triglyceride lipase/lysophosphatidylethanolamine acyltransferase [Kluyveromyces lactis]|uniref:KLLA0A10175p n=1 Tax=Kluyveromyces lactis (strain ATCC 8585 / CBS 2359 / DSM 70799 / NBRC 1267 / NRRL Y-1140 / WM37) TaxID=284590 RepID=Q6CX94_KLULA|nr:uncharacterized protein KLLA0_A10175g [Kluyveromyces lactis]CAH03033.1 KLLA0A10175p [Kluyveromyces lactis]|eukprot:XP_451445.1 uncharacterized protein KLLA0_A10175g [Kluyveromyces lactis]